MPGDVIQINPQYARAFREIGIDAEQIFIHPAIEVWRKLDDRENCVLNYTLENGEKIRWHVKRYPATNSKIAGEEVNGSQLLGSRDIPTAKLVASGALEDDRSFVIFEDLTGYKPGDKWIESGGAFESILSATAKLAAKLHAGNLHHRDLYLCHFMVRDDGSQVELAMIDTARVAEMRNPLTRRRWIVKDLAQFDYSLRQQNISDELRKQWLEQYAQARQISADSLRGAIERKVRTIARHDKKLNAAQPTRHVSINR